MCVGKVADIAANVIKKILIRRGQVKVKSRHCSCLSGAHDVRQHIECGKHWSTLCLTLMLKALCAPWASRTMKHRRPSFGEGHRPTTTAGHGGNYWAGGLAGTTRVAEPARLVFSSHRRSRYRSPIHCFNFLCNDWNSFRAASALTELRWPAISSFAMVSLWSETWSRLSATCRSATAAFDPSRFMSSCVAY